MHSNLYDVGWKNLVVAHFLQDLCMRIYCDNCPNNLLHNSFKCSKTYEMDGKFATLTLTTKNTHHTLFEKKPLLCTIKIQKTI